MPKYQVQDAQTGDNYDMEVRPDPHGCVIEIGKATVVLDLSDGRVRVLTGDCANILTRLAVE